MSSDLIIFWSETYECEIEKSDAPHYLTRSLNLSSEQIICAIFIATATWWYHHQWFLIFVFSLLQLQWSVRVPEPQIDIDVIKEITDMLIDAGIHMDAVNVEGLTAVQNCTSRKFRNAKHNMFLGHNFYNLFCFVHPFRCMSMRACVQPTYKYSYDDMSSMRSAFDVLHHDA